MSNIRLDTRGTKMSNGKAEKSPQVRVWTRAVLGKRKFPNIFTLIQVSLYPKAIKSKQIHPSQSLNKVQKNVSQADPYTQN